MKKWLINITKKKQKKSFKKKHVKGTKIFLRKKKRWKKAWGRYKNLSEEKEKKHHYCDQNKNLSEEEKQKKVEYMRNYYLALKNNF